MRHPVLAAIASSLLLATTIATTAETRPQDPEKLARNAERPAQNLDGVQVVVSLNEQRLKVFAGNQTLAESNISSGKAGYSTPTGIFSILHKKKFHRSNLYNDAPMPFMQRLTWTGIALHGSNSVPTYAASHGCVRLPDGFDKKLFGLTKTGAHVIVTGDMTDPVPVSHAVLLQPAKAVPLSNVDHWRLRLETGNTLPGGAGGYISNASLFSGAEIDAKPGKPLPLRVLITRRHRIETVREVQAFLNEMGHQAGVVDGLLGPASRAAIRRFQAAQEMPETGEFTPEIVNAIYEAAGRIPPGDAHLYVRRDFEPVFDAPVTLADPEKPMGTHLLVTSGFDERNQRTGWNAFTLENRLGPNTRALSGIDAEAVDSVELKDTLDRITIDPELRKRLEAMLTPGSSIAIADAGMERYTGWKTDFTITTSIKRGYKRAGSGRRSASRASNRPRQRASNRARRIPTGLPGVVIIRY